MFEFHDCDPIPLLDEDTWQDEVDLNPEDIWDLVAQA